MERFCKLCLRPVLITEWKTHILQKPHLQELPSKIQVKGDFKQSQVDDLYAYFGKLGGIRNQTVTLQGDEVFVEYRFWDARVYSEIIHQEHWLFNIELEISWFKKNKSGSSEYVIQDEKMNNENFVYRKIALIESLKNLPNFSEETKIFEQKMQLLKINMEKSRDIVKTELSSLLSQDFPTSKIHFFGSSITELQIHDSDLNIYLDNTDSQLSTLKKIQELITKNGNFTQISLCSDYEILKCRYKKSKIPCEINIRSEIPIGNSELIKFYITLDEKIKMLMLLIKFWMDCHGLRKNGNFSSYSLCWMIIFYLQQEPYNLPSVESLQRDVPPDEIDGWNCAFCPVEFTSSLGEATLFELMRGFFKFYSNFNYWDNIISPYLGSTVGKLENFPESYNNQDASFSVNSSICIQDPFEHSRNVSLQVPLNSIAKFAILCRKSLELGLSQEKTSLTDLLLVTQTHDFSLLMNDPWFESEWIGMIKEFVLKILIEIYGCEVEEMSDQNGAVYDCEGKCNVWENNRLTSLKNLPNLEMINPFDKEVAITNHIMESSDHDHFWSLKVTLQFESEPCRVTIGFKEEHNLPFISHVEHFFYLKLMDLLSLNVVTCDQENCEEEVSIKVELEPEGGVLVEIDEQYANPIDESFGLDPEVKNVEVHFEEFQENAQEESPFESESVDQIQERILLSPADGIYEKITLGTQQEEQSNEETEIVTIDLSDSDEHNIDSESPVLQEYDTEVDKITVPNQIEEQNVKNGEEPTIPHTISDTDTELGENRENVLNSSNDAEKSKSCTSTIINLSGNRKDTEENEVQEKIVETEAQEKILEPATAEAETSGNFPNSIPEIETEDSTTHLDVNKDEVQNEQDEFGKALNIPSEKGFKKQAISLCKTLQCDKNQQEKDLKKIYNDLSELLKPEKVQFYGSTVTGLALRYSDVNIHVKAEKNRSQFAIHLSIIKETIAGSSKFSTVSITKDKIKCLHSETGKNCVLFMKNKFCLFNTDLIKYYLSLDKKLHTFFLLVKIWGLRNKIIDENLFTSYSLYMMAIFYLQCKFQTPTVVQLQTNQKPTIIETWNCGFLKKPHYGHNLEKIATLELLEGFFKFYGSFDYFSFVIAPYFGSPVAKSRFLRPCKLPPNYSLYVNSSLTLKDFEGICVQDPFEHSRNICARISLKDSCKFATLCRHTSGLLQRHKGKSLKNLLGRNDDFLLHKAEFSILKRNEKNQDWIKTVKSFLTQILTQILHGVIKQRQAVSKHEHIFHCQGHRDIFHKRISTLKNVLKDLSKKTTAIKKEVAVTTHVIKFCPSSLWEMTLKLTFETNPYRAVVVLEGCGENIFVFSHFIFTRLLKFLNYESDMNKDSKNEIVASKKKRTSTSEASNVNVPSKIPKAEGSTNSGGISNLEELQVGSQNCETAQDDISTSVISTSGPSSKSVQSDISKKKKQEKRKNQTVQEKAKCFALNTTRYLPTFDQQVSNFCRILLVKKSKIDEMKRILHNEIVSSLILNFCFEEIIFFGSSITGLFSGDSSFDIYIEKLKPRTLAEPVLELMKRSFSDSGKFTEFAIFPSGLKCKHKEIDKICNFHITNKLQVCNSRLIGYYLTLDSKLQFLFFVVKSWASAYQLTQKDKFSNYSLYLMVIFYLQQPPYSLPPVAELKKNAPLEIIDGWNGAFSSLKCDSRPLKETTLTNLIIEFFQFYSNFDYFTYVISPFVGYAIDKTGFLQPFELPISYQNYVRQGKPMITNLKICVQDPFEHTKNITSGINLAIFGRFIALCRSVCQMSKTTEKELLHKFLSRAYCSSAEIEKPQNLHERHWKPTIRKIVDDIFRKIFCCVHLKETISNEGKKKKDYDRVVISGIAQKQIFVDRVKILKQLKRNCGIFEGDVLVSSAIAKDRPGSESFGVSVELTFVQNPSRVKLAVQGDGKQHLTHFFYTRIAAVLKTSVDQEEIHDLAVPSPSLDVDVVSEPYQILVKGTFGTDKLLQIHEYFSNFGKISKLNIIGEERKLAIEYCVENPAVYLKIIQQEHFLLDNKLQIIPMAPWKKFKPMYFKNPQLAAVHSVLKYASFSEQINELVTLLSEGEEIANTRNLVLDDLQLAIKSKFKKWKISFDSNSVSLNFNILDLQMENSKEWFPEMETLQKLIQDSDNFSDVSFSGDKIVCQHNQKEITCFLTVKTKLADTRNQLIQYYLFSHKKLKNFMMLIKFWIESHDLTESFSNSAICLMIIFFLQQKPYSLPPVKDLQTATTKYLGWDIGYEKKIVFGDSVLKRTSLRILLIGFFKFYSDFDYFTYVISPYFGSELEKIFFLKPYRLPTSFRLYVELENDLEVFSGICVQDFFDHSLNLSKASSDCVGIFAALCRSTLQKVCFDGNLVYDVLLGSQKTLFELPGFVIENSQGANEEDWIKSVKNVTLKILLDVLNYKSQMLNFESEKCSFVCLGEVDVLENRLAFLKEFEFTDLSGMDKEIEISTQIMKGSPRKISCKVSVELNFLKNPCRVEVFVKKMSGSLDVFCVGHFLYTRLLRFLTTVKESSYDDVEFVENKSASAYKNQEGTTTRESSSSPELIEAIEQIDLTAEDSSDDNNCQNPTAEENGLPSIQMEIINELPVELEPNEDRNIQVNEKEVETMNRKRKRFRIVEGEEDDDIPPDFFDDFSNETFLNGLDITDDHNPKKRGSVKSPSISKCESKTRHKRRSGSLENSHLDQKKKRRNPEHGTEIIEKPHCISPLDVLQETTTATKSASSKIIEKQQPILEEVDEVSDVQRVHSSSSNTASTVPPGEVSFVSSSEDHHKPEEIIDQRLAKKLPLSGLPSETAKLEVLGRCQDFIERTHQVPFPVGERGIKLNPQCQNKPESFASPLKQNASVEFRFTTLPKEPIWDCYGQTLNRILEETGVLKAEEVEKCEDIVDVVKRAVRSCAVVNKETVTRILKETLLGIDFEVKQKIDIGTQYLYERDAVN